jgi:hypothetical protein
LDEGGFAQFTMADPWVSLSVGNATDDKRKTCAMSLAYAQMGPGKLRGPDGVTGIPERRLGRSTVRQPVCRESHRERRLPANGLHKLVRGVSPYAPDWRACACPARR